ncbi:MAG: nicotinate-nucleotide--dimethylbenzimidazole phosphoribosyltransferase, partial [Pedobacter sp.]|nr:nicotinate-nucleotide--dimethylbenzimidazole phosphoribosyltransferase [Pedobacter sp.]
MPSFKITAPDAALHPVLQEKIDNKTKPLGALGQLEKLALQIGLVQQTLTPALKRPALLIFAADHGLAREGVSAYPQAVTAQMVLNFLRGGAAANVFSRQHGFVLKVVDAGVDAEFPEAPALITASLERGTASSLQGPAMSLAQAELALQRGADIARAEIAAGSNVLAFGEMG